MLEHLKKLAEHLAWADADALRALCSATLGDQRALVLYAHVVGAEAVWLARVAGRPVDVAVWPTLTLDEAQALAERNARELRELVASVRPEDASREIDYVNSAGKAFRSTLEDILLHVALHGAYHRGQIALLVRADGAEPAPTDYIAFIRGVPTARTVPPIPVVPVR